MCGICGIVHFEEGASASRNDLERMCSLLNHRGPDEAGYYRKDRVGLGMRRLSIIDLVTGRQPISNEDGSAWIVYNGEVYNFPQLRADLLSRGHRFTTKTDTEVILHLYEDQGKDCVNHLRGMFAFAIWDEKKRSLLLARDRLGIKPLYYFRNEHVLLFASELKSILAYPGVPKDIDMEGLLHYLQFGYIPDPYSIFQGIKKLPPGCVLLSSAEEDLHVERFWRPQFDPHPAKEAALLESFRDLLSESVRMRLISDVPVGAFLSGGIDSSMVVAMMARETDEPVRTFSIGFEEPRFNELPYARAVAQQYHTDHHEMIVRPESIDLLETIIRAFDEPFGDPSAIPTYLLSKLASEHIKVVLSGDGGDELFAGYDSYAAILRQDRYERLPQRIRTFLGILAKRLPRGAYGKRYFSHITLPRNERFINYVSHISSRVHRELLSRELQQRMEESVPVFCQHLEAAFGTDALSTMQYVDMNMYLPGDILVKVDRMSMAHSLEVRVPLLDHLLVEFAAALPSTYKLRGAERKYLMKRIASELLPRKTIERKKQGFGVPLRYWFKEDLNGYMKEVLLDRKTTQRGYLNRAYLEGLLEEHQKDRRDHSTLIWHLLVLELWHRIYMD